MSKKQHNIWRGKFTLPNNFLTILSVCFILGYAAFNVVYTYGKHIGKNTLEFIITENDTLCYGEQDVIVNVEKPKEVSSSKQNKKTINNNNNKTHTKKKTKKPTLKKYSVSPEGRLFIKTLENCKLIAYYDKNGYSIGYGRHKRGVYAGQVITQTQAEEFFDEDIELTENAINRLLNNIPYDFNQNFIDGFASLIYNCGSGGIERSSFYQTLKNNCRYYTNDDTIIKNDLKFTLLKVKTLRAKSEPLLKRRNKEYNLMITNL